MTNGNKVFEGIKERYKESTLPPRCARAWSSAAWEISFMRWKGKKKGVGTDSQLFSIKPFTISIKCSVSAWAVPVLVVHTMYWTEGTLDH